MQRLENIDQWQSMLMVFGYLFCSEVEAVVQFLSTVPGPTGASALQFVLEQWLIRERYFTGLYEHIISTVGLCKLLEYAISSHDPSFDTILIKEVARNKIDYVPVLIQVFKILVNTLCYYFERQHETQDLHPILSTSYYEMDNDEVFTDSNSEASVTDEDHHDPFFQDPIFATNLLTYLTDFVNRFKNFPSFENFFSALDEGEKNILLSITEL